MLGRSRVPRLPRAPIPRRAPGRALSLGLLMVIQNPANGQKSSERHRSEGHSPPHVEETDTAPQPSTPCRRPAKRAADGGAWRSKGCGYCRADCCCGRRCGRMRQAEAHGAPAVGGNRPGPRPFAARCGTRLLPSAEKPNFQGLSILTTRRKWCPQSARRRKRAS